MSKKNKKSKSKKKTLFSKKTLAIFIIVFSLPLLIIFALQYVEIFQKKQENTKVEKSTEVLMDKMKKMLDEEKNRLVNEDRKPKVTPYKAIKLPPVVHVKKEQDHLSEINDYKNSLKKDDKKHVKIVKKKYIPKGKPKLAIIIDDVAFAHQVKMIEQIPYKVSPSFFPPTPRHPDTVELAKHFEFAMIHLPMQALNYAKPEPDTLNVEDSRAKIQKRILQIKKWFPQISYYNNHTGSKFTSDFDAMDRLISVMQSEHLTFIDSRTTAQSKVEQVFEKHNLELFSRDIFLDNDLDKSAIQKQLLKAVNLAKKHGFSIAIGHPHTNTLSVLKNAKNILSDVELVYLKDL